MQKQEGDLFEVGSRRMYETSILMNRHMVTTCNCCVPGDSRRTCLAAAACVSGCCGVRGWLLRRACVCACVAAMACVRSCSQRACLSGRDVLAWLVATSLPGWLRRYCLHAVHAGSPISTQLRRYGLQAAIAAVHAYKLHNSQTRHLSTVD